MKKGESYTEIPASTAGASKSEPQSTRTYIVQEDGVVIGTEEYKKGDKVDLTDDEVNQQRSGGIALVAEDESDQPGDAWTEDPSSEDWDHESANP